jgi:NitT/TauT family transport system permease protein
VAPVYIKLGVFALLMTFCQGLAMLLDLPDLPSLSQTLQALYYHTHEGDLINNVWITLGRVFLSFILAMLIEVFLALRWAPKICLTISVIDY